MPQHAQFVKISIILIVERVYNALKPVRRAHLLLFALIASQETIYKTIFVYNVKKAALTVY